MGNPNPAGVNNGRDIAVNNTYAVLAAWQPDNPRFDVNLNRIYKSLTGIGIPANRIVVLAPASNATPNIDGGLPAIPVTGAATEDNFKKAIAGTLFAAGVPDNSSKLLVYNTGHGNSWDNSGATGKATVPVNPGPPKKLAVKAKDVADMPATAFADEDGGGSGSGVVDLQFALQSPLDPSDVAGGVTVSINGLSPIGTLLPSAVPFDLNAVIGTASYYEISIPLGYMASLSPSPIEIELGNMFFTNVTDSLVKAVTFDSYGDTWSMGVDPVPEPAACSLMAISMVALAAWRKRRAC